MRQNAARPDLWGARVHVQRDTARCEDVAQGQSRAHQTGLHCGRPAFSPKLQRPVRPHEVVVTAQEFHVSAEMVFTSGVARRTAAEVRRALTNREVEALDERGVESR